MSARRPRTDIAPATHFAVSTHVMNPLASILAVPENPASRQSQKRTILPRSLRHLKQLRVDTFLGCHILPFDFNGDYLQFARA